MRRMRQVDESADLPRPWHAERMCRSTALVARARLAFRSADERHKQLSSSSRIVASAHAVLASACCLNLVARCCAVPAKAANIVSLGRMTIAKAHVVLARHRSVPGLHEPVACKTKPRTAAQPANSSLRISILCWLSPRIARRKIPIPSWRGAARGSGAPAASPHVQTQ